MLTHPEKSLASVHAALQMFNRVSYYKVNESKSYILGLGIDTQLRQRLSSWFPYKWSDDSIKYLGIILTASTEALVAANYIPFLNSLSSKLHDIAKTEFLWSGRLAAFKMVILPQLIYLFRTLPIPIPNSYFSQN